MTLIAYFRLSQIERGLIKNNLEKSKKHIKIIRKYSIRQNT